MVPQVSMCDVGYWIDGYEHDSIHLLSWMWIGPKRESEGIRMPEEMIMKHIYSSAPDPLKVKVMKMSKGYQWEISYTGADQTKILEIIKSVDAALYAEYGAQ
jgi:hypothetical protein